MRYLQGDAIQRQTAQDSHWIRWHLPHLKWDPATHGTADVLRELRESLKQPRRRNFSGEEWARQNQHNAEEESAHRYGYPYEWVGRRSAHRRPLPGTGVTVLDDPEAFDALVKAIEGIVFPSVLLWVYYFVPDAAQPPDLLLAGATVLWGLFYIGLLVHLIHLTVKQVQPDRSG